MKKENINKKTEEQILEEAITKYMQALIKIHIVSNKIVLKEMEL